MNTGKTLADLFAEVELANAAEWDRLNTPEKIAEREKRQKAEFEQGVRLGWWDADGNPTLPIEEEEDDDA